MQTDELDSGLYHKINLGSVVPSGDFLSFQCAMWKPVGKKKGIYLKEYIFARIHHPAVT